MATGLFWLRVGLATSDPLKSSHSPMSCGPLGAAATTRPRCGKMLIPHSSNELLTN